MHLSWAVKLQKLLLFKACQIFLHESQLCKGAIAFTNALLSLITVDAYNALVGAVYVFIPAVILFVLQFYDHVHYSAHNYNYKLLSHYI